MIKEVFLSFNKGHFTFHLLVERRNRDCRVCHLHLRGAVAIESSYPWAERLVRQGHEEVL